MITVVYIEVFSVIFGEKNTNFHIESKKYLKFYLELKKMSVSGEKHSSPFFLKVKEVGLGAMTFNATVNNISVISRKPEDP